MPRVITCHIAGCTKVHPREHAMCREHWPAVPADLKTEVYAAYRARGGDGGIGRHMQALEAAYAAVEDREARDLFGGGPRG